MTNNESKSYGPTTAKKLGILVLSTMLLVTFLVPLSSDDASASTPCPHFSIHDVFADPGGNWDGDHVNNSDELYNGLNPCIRDTANFCGGGGNPLCTYPRTVYTTVPDPCQAAINASPNGDYDGDGVSNAEEIRNFANPCTHPCPNPTNADLALNPNGSWDNDGISNAIEINQGTNPCDGYSYYIVVPVAVVPCPYYTIAQVNAAPHADWDGDGITNATELRRGYNPCQRTTVVTTSNRLPHVSAQSKTVHITPVPYPVHVCPTGYPYFHRGNGLCYANPIGHTWR